MPLRLLNGNFSGGRKVGTLHNMRLFSWTTTKFFATAYDGEWDVRSTTSRRKSRRNGRHLSASEGWPGIHSPQVKDWIVAHQIPADGWYVAHPDLTVAEATRLFTPAARLEISSTNLANYKDAGMLPIEKPLAKLPRRLRLHRAERNTGHRSPTAARPYFGTHIGLRIDDGTRGVNF